MSHAPLQPDELSAIVRRVVGRVYAERGARETAPARGTGVFVHVAGDEGAPRPHAATKTSNTARGRELVSVEALDGLARGARLHVGPEAIVTELARDEARRRGITLDTSAVRDDTRRRLAFAADHGGYALKDELAAHARSLGHEVVDLGTRDGTAVDYPDFARLAAEAVVAGTADLAVVVDAAGIGSAMAANKVPGARAANCWDVASAQNAREHNFANVLTLGARRMEPARAREILAAFLGTATGEERHARRIAKIDAIERHYGMR